MKNKTKLNLKSKIKTFVCEDDIYMYYIFLGIIIFSSLTIFILYFFTFYEAVSVFSITYTAVLFGA